MLSEKEKKKWEFIIEQLRLARQELKKDNDKSERKEVNK